MSKVSVQPTRSCRNPGERYTIVPATALDSPMNWVAMCRECQGALAGVLPPMAGFVYHVHDSTKLLRQLRELGRWSILAIAAATWLGFAALIVGRRVSDIWHVAW